MEGSGLRNAQAGGCGGADELDQDVGASGCVGSTEAAASSLSEGEVDFDAMKRVFLYHTAKSLAVSRVATLRDVKRVVDQLGEAVANLDSLREALDDASALHAHLKSSIARDLRRAVAVVDKHDFDSIEPGARSESFASVLERVVDMFMVDGSAAQDHV